MKPIRQEGTEEKIAQGRGDIRDLLVRLPVLLVDGILKFQTLVDLFGSYALVETTLLFLVILPTAAVYIFSKEHDKTGRPFEADMAEWQYEAAMDLYCRETRKAREDLTPEDEDIIWERACNRMSVFLTWAICKGYCGRVHMDEEPEAVRQLVAREIGGTDFFIKHCDCKLWRADFPEEILPFVDAYYESRYLEDYVAATRKKLHKEPLAFPFSWDDFEVYDRMVSRAYRRWRFRERPLAAVGKKP